jgi:hypothetical protein
MREIRCANGKIALVDDDDYDAVSRFSWTAKRARQRDERWYVIRKGRGVFQNATIYLHRQILGVGDGVHVDHRDGDGLNNTRDNLRACTQSQNQASANCRKSASGYRGVTWDGGKQRWCAMGYRDGVRVHLGRYVCPAEAARARDAFARQHFGDFARLNFPLEGERRA